MDGSRIQKEKVEDSKIFGYVWKGPDAASTLLYDGEFLKQRYYFYSLNWPSAHTNPSRKRSFSKTNSRLLKTPPFRFGVDGKHFENATFVTR